MLGKNFGGLNLFTQFLAYFGTLLFLKLRLGLPWCSEQASVAFPKETNLYLPGIGSYIQVALNRADFKSCLWAVLPY